MQFYRINRNEFHMNGWYAFIKVSASLIEDITTEQLRLRPDEYVDLNLSEIADDMIYVFIEQSMVNQTARNDPRPSTSLFLVNQYFDAMGINDSTSMDRIVTFPNHTVLDVLVRIYSEQDVMNETVILQLQRKIPGNSGEIQFLDPEDFHIVEQHLNAI